MLAFAKDQELRILNLVVVSVLLRLTINLFSYNSAGINYSQIIFSVKLIIFTGVFCGFFSLFYVEEFEALHLIFGVVLCAIVASIFASITLLVKAMRYPISYFNRIAFYASGILFDPKKLEEPLLSLAKFNPFYWIYVVVMG